MKRFRYFRFTLAAAGMALMALGGCTSRATKSGSAAEQDSVLQQTAAFATDSIAFCEQKDSTLKCSVVVDYPSGDDSLSVGVRRYIAGELARLFLPTMQEEDEPAAVFKGAKADGKALVDFYGKLNFGYLKSQYAELKELGIAGLSYDLSIRKTYETDRYLTYETSCYVFLGGAHGSAVCRPVNIVKATGKVLAATIDTLKQKALQPILRRGVKEYISKAENRKIKDRDLQNMLFVEHGIIPLPATMPVLTPEGLRFVYQQYEIGPYALGMVEFTVPYADVKSCLTPEAAELALE
mgnify:FL=1